LPVERVALVASDAPQPTEGSVTPMATKEPPPTDKAKTSGFIDYRTTLSYTRSNAAALLDEVIADTTASAETIQQAIKKKAELADAMTMEGEIETLLKARGFLDVLCTINAQSVTVVVQSDGLTQQQASQIMDIAVSVSGQPASNIKIIQTE